MRMRYMKRGLMGLYVIILATAVSGFISPYQFTGALEKGDTAPDFTTRTTSGKDITLSTMVEEGNVVILFFQGFWCTGCHKSLCHFKDDLAKVTKKGGHTIAISPTPLSGRPHNRERPQKDVSIVIDEDLSIMRGFGIIDDNQTEYLRASINFGKQDFSFIPATYIIDENLTVKFAHVDPDFTINAFVDSLLVHP